MARLSWKTYHNVRSEGQVLYGRNGLFNYLFIYSRGIVPVHLPQYLVIAGLERYMEMPADALTPGNVTYQFISYI